MFDSLQIFARAMLTFVFLILVTRVAGKRMLSQMTNDQFAAAITLGSIAGNMVFNLRIKLLYFVVAFFVFSSIVYVMGWMSLRSRRLRRLLEGEATVIIDGGHILEENMKRERFSLEDLQRGLRGQGIFDIEEVEHAVLETDGTLSVLRKRPYHYLTQRDFGQAMNDSLQLPVELIVEGEIAEAHLARHGLRREWLLQELAARSLSLSHVFYAVRGTNGYLYIDTYEKET